MKSDLVELAAFCRSKTFGIRGFRQNDLRFPAVRANHQVRQTKLSLRQTEVSLRQTEVSLGRTEVRLRQTDLGWRRTNLGWGRTKVGL
jgi:hypothetical protein